MTEYFVAQDKEAPYCACCSTRRATATLSRTSTQFPGWNFYLFKVLNMYISTVFAGSPLPRDCAGRAQLQHNQQEARCTEESSHLLGFNLGPAPHSLRPRPAVHPLPGRPKVPPAAQLPQASHHLDRPHYKAIERLATGENQLDSN